MGDINLVKKTGLALVFGLIILLFPFNTTLVPEWKIQVVNENNIPYKGQLVRQHCDNYTLGVSPCSGKEDSAHLTDENGYVIFPERKITVNLFFRIIRSLYNLLMILAHGSYGASVYLDSSGPDGYKTLEYKSDGILPEKFVLPSKVSGETNQADNFPSLFR